MHDVPVCRMHEVYNIAVIIPTLLLAALIQSWLAAKPFQPFSSKFLRYLTKNGITCSLVYKPLIKREPNVLTMLQAGKMDMVIDIPDSMAPLQQVDDRERLC